MLFRFCLYGFLKNQQYYEAFIMLAFLEKGMSFFLIGLLVTIRELTSNLFEIPSGAVADLYGRRRALLFSFMAYIISFAVLGYSATFFQIAIGMIFFGFGDAFRTGTHKAIIMHWLEHNNRIDEKTEFYGRTRSWSRLGSALSAVIAAALVFRSGSFSTIFYWSMIPYLAGIINILTYPEFLDCRREGKIIGHLASSLSSLRKNRSLRFIISETMAWDGFYKAIKSYLQPLIKSAALALPLFLAYGGRERTAVLTGGIYFFFHILESRASRSAHLFRSKYSGEEAAAQSLWLIRLVVYAMLLPAFLYSSFWPAIIGFVCLGVLHNLWRPIQIGRIQGHTEEGQNATILSVDSQAKSVTTMFLAPILGLAVDRMGFWPIAVLGLLVCILRLKFLPPAIKNRHDEHGHQLNGHSPEAGN